MSSGASLGNPAFLNTLGYASGLVLFGVLTALVLKTWRRGAGRSRGVSLMASLSVLLWNAGSLTAVALAQQGNSAEWLVDINFSILSLLPAVLFSVVLQHREPVLVQVGYVVGACSVGLHLLELFFHSFGLHEWAILLLSSGFAFLVVLAGIRAVLRKDRSISFAGLISLFLFAISFLHFVLGHVSSKWRDEVGWHHVVIPLALVVLLRDYRFLLLETYVRFLANLLLAVGWALLAFWVVEAGHLLQRAIGNPFLSSLLLIGFCCWLVLFAYARSWLDEKLNRTIFRHGDLNACSRDLVRIASESQTEGDLFERAAALMARFVKAERYAVTAQTGDDESWVEAEIPLRFSRGDSLRLCFGRRHGSRRYRQDDLESLNHLAFLLVEQVERFRTNELQRLAQEAELRALQAQVNPHFLFNALNTLYGTIGTESSAARNLVLNLAELFRYCLQRDRTFIPLGEELEIVQAYLEIEKLRLGDRLQFEIVAPEDTRREAIPVLSVQPLVENAIKHGVAKLPENGRVRIVATRSLHTLQVVVEDNGPGLTSEHPSPGLGIGLQNVRQRVQLSYGESAELRIVSGATGCTATLSIPLHSPGVRRPPEADRSYGEVVRSYKASA